MDLVNGLYLHSAFQVYQLLKELYNTSGSHMNGKDQMPPTQEEQ